MKFTQVYNCIHLQIYCFQIKMYFSWYSWSLIFEKLNFYNGNNKYEKL